MWRVLIFITYLLTGGCASSPYMLPESDSESTAEGAAWTGSGMYSRKAMPDRRDWKPWEFYYKHCSMGAADQDVSKTAYECTGPFH